MDGPFAFFLLICVLFGVAAGLQGRSKGSSFLLWFVIGVFLPLFGFIAALVYPGRQHELRRTCDGCGRLLPITDTMCMGCGTDLAFPEVRYLPEGVEFSRATPPAQPEPAVDDDGGSDESPYAVAAAVVGEEHRPGATSVVRPASERPAASDD